VIVGPQFTIPEDPVRFVDAETKSLIKKILVLGVYSSTAGVGAIYGFGHGPSTERHTKYVGHPFVYHSGEPFHAVHPRTLAVVVIPVGAIGRFVNVYGEVVAVAPGYKVKAFYPSRSREQQPLIPLRPGEASAELERFLREIQKPMLTSEDKDWFPAAHGESMEVRLSSSDRRLIREFILEGLAQQGSRLLPVPRQNSIRGAEEPECQTTS